MKQFSSILVAIFLAGSVLAYQVPTDDQVAQVLTTPSDLPGLIDGATPEQAAEVVARVIQMAERSPNLDEYQKRQVAALMTARAVFAITVGDPAFVSTLMGYMFTEWQPLVAAAALAASRDSVHDVRQILSAIADQQPDLALQEQVYLAIDEPREVLGDELYYIIAAILPHVPIKELPAASLSVPLPPPPPSREPRSPVVRDDPTRGVPPAGRKYPGQRGLTRGGDGGEFVSKQPSS